MSDRDNITLPRKVVKLALEALEWSWGGEPMGTLEREACAKVVESRKMGASELMDAVRDMEAAAIRKRGEVKP